MPILSWLPRYDRSWLTFDAIAGLTLWGLVVPEGMAYAGIAGLPPQAGLYTLVVSLLVYALLGTSRHLSVGGTSATAALLASSVAAALVASASATASDPQAYAVYASAFVLVTGLVFLVAGIARLGFITQFLSKPVMDGFVVGLAVFVTVGQLNKLFGVEKPEGNTIEKLVGIIRELPQANLTTFAVGAVALAALALLPRLSRRLPAGLVVLFGAIALSSALDLEGHGVAVVGTLPQGLPIPALPVVPLADYLGMVLPAIGVLLVAFSESLGVAHEFAEKHGYEVDSDQELNAHAVVNLGSALFGGMLAAGEHVELGRQGGRRCAHAGRQPRGLGRDHRDPAVPHPAVHEPARGRAGRAHHPRGLAHPLVAEAPDAAQGGPGRGVVRRPGARRRAVHRRPAGHDDRPAGLAGLRRLPVEPAAPLVARTSSRDRGAYSDLTRHPENLPVPGVLIVRLDAPMYYANALTARDRVKAMIREAAPPPRAVIFDAEGQDDLDLTSAEMLKGLVAELHRQGPRGLLRQRARAGARARARDRAARGRGRRPRLPHGGPGGAGRSRQHP